MTNVSREQIEAAVDCRLHVRGVLERDREQLGDGETRLEQRAGGLRRAAIRLGVARLPVALQRVEQPGLLGLCDQHLREARGGGELCARECALAVDLVERLEQSVARRRPAARLALQQATDRSESEPVRVQPTDARDLLEM